MEMPEIQRCFGMFPPKYATYLIAIFGLSSGGVGLACIILYGLIEKALTYFFTGRDGGDLDNTVKKVTLLTVGITSLLLLISNTLLFLGATVGSRGALESGVWIIFVMCLILIALAIGGPISCFFYESSCIMKKISTSTMLFSGLTITIFLEIWLYFMCVSRTYLNNL